MNGDLRRQGDVLIEEIADIPDHTRKKQGLVLVEGEVTGHTHQIAVEGTAQLHVDTGRRNFLYIEVLADSATLIHPEHAPIVLPKANYRVWRQREFIEGRILGVAD
jgi:hypothetical protein